AVSAPPHLRPARSTAIVTAFARREGCRMWRRKGVCVFVARRFRIALPAIAGLLVGGVGAGQSLGRSDAPVAASKHRNAYFAGWSYPEAGKAAVTAEVTVPVLNCSDTNTGVPPGSFS